MAVAVVERFKKESMYGLSAARTKNGRCGKIALVEVRLYYFYLVRVPVFSC